MKQKIFTLAVLLITGISFLWAQAPQKFNYQGIARSSAGVPLINKFISLRLSILDGGASGSVQYMETQSTTTNQFGLFNVAMGTGSIVVGTISSVAWSTGDKYLKVEMDPNGGSSWVDLGTTQLLSVPYAMYAMTPAGPQGPQGPQGIPGAGSLNGTANKIIKFTSATVGGESQLYDDGTFIGVGATSGLGAEKFRLNFTPNSSGFTGMNISSTSATSKTFLSFGNNDLLLGWMYFDGTDDNKFKINNGGDKMTITRAGLVGIGTTDPNNLLSLYSETDNNYIKFNNTYSGTLGNDGLIMGMDTDGNGMIYNYENQPIYFATNNSFKMALTQDGRVNIGDVYASSGQLNVVNNGGGLGYPTAHFTNNNANGVSLFAVNSSADATSVFSNEIGATGTHNAIMAKFFDGGANDLVRIDNFDFYRMGRIQFFDISSGSGGGFISGSSSFGALLGEMAPSTGVATIIANVDMDGSNNMMFVPWLSNMTSLGSADYRWSAVWATNGTIQTSDERDKQNIKPLEYGINTVMSLKPVSYQWKNDKSRIGSGTNLGFIAQELEKVIPDAVVHSTASAQDIENAAKAGRGIIEADSYGVKYSEIIPVLVKAIQDQQALIEQLQSQVNLLKNK